MRYAPGDRTDVGSTVVSDDDCTEHEDCTVLTHRGEYLGTPNVTLVDHVPTDMRSDR